MLRHDVLIVAHEVHQCKTLKYRSLKSELFSDFDLTKCLFFCVQIGVLQTVEVSPVKNMNSTSASVTWDGRSAHNLSLTASLTFNLFDS